MTTRLPIYVKHCILLHTSYDSNALLHLALSPELIDLFTRFVFGQIVIQEFTISAVIGTFIFIVLSTFQPHSEVIIRTSKL